MNKKEMQKKRMMNYFIEAAKEIIERDGIQSLSVRRVGALAGYSYATIYNYFKDLNTLLHYCILDYLDDCYKYITKKLENSIDCENTINDRARIELMIISYVEYFTKNPNQFQLIFVEDLGKPSKEVLEELRRPSVGVLLYDEIEKYAYKKETNPKDAEILGDLISYSVHGKLLMYLKGRKSTDINGLIESVRSELDFLFSKL
ncbi:TetR/AcrR family transcriptional regulator [Wukongibacter baidiensis]|uniref:TetR/AcrR family transcriptional regulator n=1 Tax=Wukongibacter baidiensis TaxID=1723361 RepID=UPI003D7F72EE